MYIYNRRIILYLSFEVSLFYNRTSLYYCNGGKGDNSENGVVLTRIYGYFFPFLFFPSLKRRRKKFIKLLS